MMRDHRNLRAFQLADELALLVYRETAGFPREELFGLTSQIRRAAVSVASNIAEGCGRSTDTDFLRFLDMANGSLRELQYQISLAQRLGYPRLQVVAQGMIDGSDSNVLSVHLPFDIDSGQHENHLRFLELELSVAVHRKDTDGIPCFYANFGTDYEYADRVILQLLVQLYQYSPSDQFTCEVYDEGLMTKIRPRQAPPGGTTA